MYMLTCMKTQKRFTPEFLFSHEAPGRGLELDLYYSPHNQPALQKKEKTTLKVPSLRLLSPLNLAFDFVFHAVSRNATDLLVESSSLRDIAELVVSENGHFSNPNCRPILRSNQRDLSI